MTTLRQSPDAGIITKTLIAIFALGALAVSAGNANAHIDKSRIHKTYGYVNKSPVKTTTTVRHEQAAPLMPLDDCVHVAFPQCGG